MELEEIKFISSEQIQQLANESLTMKAAEAYPRWATLRYELFYQSGKQLKNQSNDYPLSANLVLLYDSFALWSWFARFGIQPEDYSDVIEEAPPFVALILSKQYTELNQLDGLDLFIENARKRYQYIPHTEKCIDGWENDPIGS